MKFWFRSFILFVLVATTTLLVGFGHSATSLPWRKAGLTERQAAAHLLSRFSFGARPGEVDEVVHTGLEQWLQQQLEASLPEPDVTQRLAGYESLTMSNKEITDQYPRPAFVLRRAVKEGLVEADSVKIDKKEYREALQAYMENKGLKPQAELFRQLINQKIIRAVYARNQLQEVLTDFWFNHFNVSLTKGESKPYVTAYERDCIRPFVLGKFEDMLLATAHSPAMLSYLDNAKSVASDQQEGPMQKRLQQRAARRLQQRAGEMSEQRMEQLEKVKQNRKAKGLNENYAREIMELHTLGVDGGYTQQDVTEAARVLTGWTFVPMEEEVVQLVDGAMAAVGESRLKKAGFVRKGDFVFRANQHDKGEKTVMGVHFANEGYNEGLRLIHLLATHPSTAQFLARKLAIRFVSDTPPQALVNAMAQTFLQSGGDLKAVLTTMAYAPEFWQKEVLRDKTKSPFEVAVSAIRSLNAEVVAPFPLYNWITKMGQKFYYYQAPTGFPDRGQYWINTGSLLNRMNFGLALAAGRVPGVQVNLKALNNNREPESAEAALVTYTQILLPERNVDETVKRLQPMLHAPDLEQKVAQAAGKNGSAQIDEELMDETPDKRQQRAEERIMAGKPAKNNKMGKRNEAVQLSAGDNTLLAQVVGIIIGSPEFQRR